MRPLTQARAALAGAAGSYRLVVRMLRSCLSPLVTKRACLREGRPIRAAPLRWLAGRRCGTAFPSHSSTLQTLSSAARPAEPCESCLVARSSLPEGWWKGGAEMGPTVPAHSRQPGKDGEGVPGPDETRQRYLSQGLRRC